MRKVFFSFHFANDAWRAGQIRNMGMVEGECPVSDNDWEEVKRKGDNYIQNWIDTQLIGKSCTVVLVGSETSSRKWVRYEITKAWNLGKGVMGIYVHDLEDSSGSQSPKGDNPFDYISIGNRKMSEIVKCYDSPYKSSKFVYEYIQKNIATWVEEAIRIRSLY